MTKPFATLTDAPKFRAWKALATFAQDISEWSLLDLQNFNDFAMKAIFLFHPENKKLELFIPRGE